MKNFLELIYEKFSEGKLTHSEALRLIEELENERTPTGHVHARVHKVTSDSPVLLPGKNGFGVFSSPDTPRKISLTALPGDQAQAITASTDGPKHSPREDKDASKMADHVRSVISLDALEKELTASLAEVLFIKRGDVDTDKPFIELGLDSIVGVEWAKAISLQYGLKISTSKVYDHPTIREFSEFLEKEIRKQEPPYEAPLETSTDPGPPVEIRTDENQTAHKAEQVFEDAVKPEDRYGLVLSGVHAIDELTLYEWIVPEPGPAEITIEVKASAINFPDAMCVKGLYPTMPEYPFVPGFEVSGIVSRVGDDVLDIGVGDEVIALTGEHMGGHAASVNVPATATVKKPANISFEAACSLPVVFGAVYYAFELGKLAPEEHVLIQTATGGCGLMAVQLARLRGAVCYGTSSRPEKLALLKQLGIAHALNYKTSEFDREINRITNGRGIDVVLNMVSGDAIQRGLNCLAASGRYLELAVHALKTSPALDLSKLVRNQSIYSIDLRRLGSQSGYQVREMLDLMVRMVESEAIVPIVSRIYPVGQITEALEYVSLGRHIGKVVLSHTSEAMIDCADECLEGLLRQKQKAETGFQVTPTKKSAPIETRRQEYIHEGIAIIGMSGQFPQARTPALFWENLVQGRDCVSEIPATRWPIDQFYDPNKETFGKTYCKWMGVLEDVDRFDPLFFSISPAEAQCMDPQQRLFLENAWSCIEDSGYRPSALSGSRCGVFVGCATSDYGQLMDNRALSTQGFMGGASSILPARVAYLLNLKGPCLSIDTACSSSLVAMAEACNSLILQTGDLALAGGVCVLSGPSMHIMASQGQMLSKDGRCFTFDQRANGFVPGEGVGVVLLKRLSDAERDQDRIYGVLRGWGINQDGKTNGITAPSVKSQIALEKEIYERFNINPETISLIEAHGTGTKLGDPIEVEALTESFRAYTNRKNYCALGSVKSNVGHLLTAAGVAGVIKVLLSLKYRQLPPTIHYDTLNEHIELEGSPFYVNTTCKKWDVPEGQKRCAAISSFGFSGTNAHVVIEEYEDTDPLSAISDRLTDIRPALIVLSAKDEDRLKESARNLYDYLTGNRAPEAGDLHEVAYTLQVGREAMDERLGLIVGGMEELTEKLKKWLENQDQTNDLFRGQVKHNREAPAEFNPDEDLRKAMDAWSREGTYEKLLELWLKGLNFNWNKLYGDRKPRRIGLPTYPFLRRRCWISDQHNVAVLPSAPPAQADAPAPVDLSLSEPLRQAPIPSVSLSPVKPNGIALEPLLKERKLYDQPETDLDHSVERPSADQPSSASQITDNESEAGDGIRPAVTRGVLQEELITSLAKITYIEQSAVKLDKSFLDVGMDSVFGVEWIREINRQYGTSVVVSDIHEYPTIRTFAEFLKKKIDMATSGSMVKDRKKESTGPVRVQPGLEVDVSRGGSSISELKVQKPDVRFSTADDIAIIGLGGRYPQANTIQTFWENIKRGKDCIEEIPKDRWDHRAAFDEEQYQLEKPFCKWGGFIEGVDRFDPLFFNLSPRQAEIIDPNERLFLETVWDLLESSGYTRETLRDQYQRAVGVYVGVMSQQYHSFDADRLQESVISMSSYYSIPNRVSYFFDLQGPSMAVDTACSSSLVAIHMACENLKSGACRLAIAGGVNLSIHPNKYVTLSVARAVASHPGSRSFGDGDGYIPAEGVGALLLKPLSQAVQNKDTILAVIKSSATNHGGLTSGFSVPNPEAQACLIEDNFIKSGIDPRTISYIEAAANGSALGDSVEVDALTKTFRKFTTDRQFCAIGSVKSNIGHAEAASGISQLTKVVLQLRHQQLVPSIQATPLNPNIDFANTPFYVQEELQEWKRPVIGVDGTEREFPRRAAVSSFAAGGSNAHLIVEEYVQKDEGRIAPDENTPYIIVLSAKDEDGLKKIAHNLHLHLTENREPGTLNLHEVAYTLQVGREAMEERVGFLVDSMDVLREKLQGFLKGQGTANDIFRGPCTDKHADLICEAVDPALRSLADEWIQNKRYAELLTHWVNGGFFDWNRLYGDMKSYHVNLPTYPFARERCWVAAKVENETRNMESGQRLHPLVHEKISGLPEPRFRSSFTGKEFFLADHLIHGVKVLPGVAYMEMVRAAGSIAGEREVVALKNMVWARPMDVYEEAREVSVHLMPKAGHYTYEVSTLDETQEAHPALLHFQGKLIMEGEQKRETPGSFDISNIQSRCTMTQKMKEIVTLFGEQGFGGGMGGSFQAMECFQYNEKEALATLKLPDCMEEGSAFYTLHPSMMDGVFEAVQLWEGLSSQSNAIRLPFALQELWIHGKLPKCAYVYVRRGLDSDLQNGMVKYDMELTNEHGESVVSCKGYTMRALEPEPKENVVQPALNTWKAEDAQNEFLAGAVRQELIKQVSDQQKIKTEKIEVEKNLSLYGFDSVGFTELTNRLNRSLGLELMPTLFFEHTTLRSLVDYLIQDHSLCLLKKYQRASEHAVVTQPSGAVAEHPEANVSTQGAGHNQRARSPEFYAGVEPGTSEPIAIVGMSGRFPQSANVDELWAHLESNHDLIAEVPEDRWDWRQYYGDPHKDPMKTNVKWGGFIGDADRFDPLFFGISPREAELLDPQLRLVMESVWTTIEDAGYRASLLSGSRTGVFVGVSSMDYKELWQQTEVVMDAQWDVPIMFHCAIPNRVSYLLNLHGPSEAIDTACSSSLIALHRAVESIRQGTSEMALVGGVSLMFNPGTTIGGSLAGMLSEDGRCKTFDKRADGYGRGEGVGTVFLKPLNKAVDDGDHIYGLIRGSAENHGGKASSPTAPNPAAQQKLLMTAYANAGINPLTVSYIEAHGTGTELGDPIEVNALKNAFAALYKQHGLPMTEEPHCALGTVKTNIGHLEAGAGISGFIKVLLMLKHRKIPGNIHLKEQNPYVQLEGSPFYLAKEIQDWNVLMDEDETPLPRRAGVSSFGIGGSNAHVIIEEWVAERGELDESGKKCLIVLSAKNEKRLKEAAQNLLTYLTRSEDPGARRLHEVAYTLQVGREAMEERLGIIVESVDELTEKLNLFLEDQDYVEGFYRGQVKRNKEALAVFAADEELQEALGKWIQRGKFSKLLDLWVKGLVLDWNMLYGDKKNLRISLPTYPFSRDRYWMAGNAKSATLPPEGGKKLHPLVHENTSNFEEQRFSSIFTGEEFFLADDVMNGQKVLPGAACLEMARAAMEEAGGPGEKGGEGILFQNVVWAQRLAVDHDGKEVHVGLFPDDKGQIQFDVYTENPSEEDVLIHSQGALTFISVDNIPALDLPALQAAFQQKPLSKEGEILTRLSLPSWVDETYGQFILHPGLLDSALQAAIRLALEGEKKWMPYAFQSLEVYGPCPSNPWIYIRAHEVGPEERQQLDLDLCDEAGQVWIRMKGLSYQALEGSVSEMAVEPAKGLTMMSSVWDVVPGPETNALFPSETDQVVLVGGSKEQRDTVRKIYPGSEALDIHSEDSLEKIASRLKALPAFDHIVWFAPDRPLKTLTEASFIEEQTEGVLQVFRLTKALLDSGYGSENLGWTVITTQTQAIRKKDSVHPAHAGVHGLIGSLAKEYPNWKVRLLDLEVGCDWPIREMFTLPVNALGDALAYRGKEWFQHALIPIMGLSGTEPLYRSQGVYVVIGGAGGIGEAWSAFMIEQYQARIVWLGRRAIDETVQAKLDRFAQTGPAPIYISADAADRTSLEKAYAEIKHTYPEIHGVVHSAIVLLDKSLASMDEERFLAGLSAKVDVSVRLAQVFQKETLDFVLFFSSMQSFLKAPGQSNYAAGCTFKDAFAHQLGKEWPCAVKVMNWGYWGRVGVVSDPSYRKRIEREGIGSIEPEEGMDALKQLLQGPLDRVASIKTLRPGVLKSLEAEEWLKDAPEALLSAMEHLRNHPPVRETDVDVMPSAAELQSVQEMNDLLLELLRGSLQSLGFFNEKKQKLADLKTKSVSLYDRWIDESLRVLRAGGYLEFEGEADVIKGPAVDLETSWNRWDELKRKGLEDADHNARIVLIETCLRALPDILVGKKQATDVMFPDSSMKLVEGMYKENTVANHFNEVLGRMVVTYIEGRLAEDASSRVRILEIGAGTGGTTAGLLSKLRPYQDRIAEYCYTDLSKLFLFHAEEHYAPDNPFLVTQIFNVEKPLAEQGMALDRYDVVIAANVLHATKNIRQTLRNTKATLRKHGLLFFNEMSRNSLFAHLTFGLLEGWWLYEDAGLRMPGCPGLTSEAWAEILEDEGFHATLFPARSAHDLGQQIIVAESDGLIRQQQSCASGGMPVHKKAQPGIQPSFTRKNKPPTSRVRRASSNSMDVTDQMVEDYVKETILDNLSISLKMDITQIDADESFADYGLDSITGVQLGNAINQTLGLKLETTVLFDYNSANELTAYIVSTYKEALMPALATQGEQLIDRSEEKHEAVLSPEPRFKRRSFSRIKRVDHQTVKNTSELGPIAIVGMSGRFAQSETLEAFWKHLAAGTDLVEEVTRWDLSLYYGDHSDNGGYCRHGSFIESVDLFDPLFFKISGLEATYMDPQQRLFLEESWKALEDAGYAGESIEEKHCGVYVGCVVGDYTELLPENRPVQAFWGNAGSIVPARIAYYLNLKGPAVAIDTACSSSLVSIHLACQGLWTREIGLALAGGICVQSTPGFYQLAGQAGMLSSSGRCYTFDERADGFVPGEGVGVVVLKRLEDALADSDHIHGVIRGSGINQDGSTNGIIAPSAKSQERLEREVYDRFNIHPETIQLVEAHGTGTILGDPIEYEALCRAFRHDTEKEGFCAIGSVKTNVGHTSTAAGVTGLMKVLLSLRHKAIPPSLHYRKNNPAIDFDKSPFYVNTELQDWAVEENAPRRAAISSFGFSGTNAHMVLEEAPDTEHPHTDKPGYLIVLSARTSEQLREQVENLLGFCREEADVDLGHMSYTLFVGRTHWNHRLACVVRNGKELIGYLEKWLSKGEHVSVYVGALQDGKRHQQASLKRYGNQCIQESRTTSDATEYLEHLSTLADLYIQGYRLAFRDLFGEGYSRFSLPTYPFARERYWVEKTGDPLSVSSNQKQVVLHPEIIHPLVHKNTSTLAEQRFSSTFTGEEFFLADHVMRGHKMLPGVAYLEMARAAMAEASGTEAGAEGEAASASIQLRNVVWTRPLVVSTDAREIHIGLSPEENAGIQYSIYTDSSSVEATEVLSQGSATFHSSSQIAALDLASLKAVCNRNHLTSAQYYEIAEAMGVDYGPSHQGIENVYVGDGLVLAELSLPSCVAATHDQFVLHPSIMDSALQAAIGLALDNQDLEPGNQELFLPFALESLEIFKPCPATLWTLIQPSEGSRAGKNLQKIDLDLCDEGGNICVRLKGFSSRVIEGEGDRTDKVGLLMCRPSWREAMVLSEACSIKYAEHLVMLCEVDDLLLEDIELRKNGERYFRLESEEKDIAERFQTYAGQAFEQVRTIFKEKPRQKVLVQIAVSNRGEQRLFQGLAGLLKTAYMENPNILGQLIEIDEGETKLNLIDTLEENSRCPDDIHIRYEGGKRMVACLKDVEATPEKVNLPWREGGVYLISGGAGGLGLIFARDIAEKINNPTLILIGRSALSEKKQGVLKDLESLGARVEYSQVDVTDKKAVDELMQRIQKNVGSLHGIIHSAGVIRDNFILKKTQVELEEVLGPKVSGLVNVDRASQELPLDFFVFFSAGASVLGNPGQADYAMANGFMDSYAEYRNTLVAAEERRGQTLSINWPLWKEGGMSVDKATEMMMRENLGMTAMETASGLEALYEALALGRPQVMVIEGNVNRLRAVLAEEAFKPEVSLPEETEINIRSVNMGGETVEERALDYFKKQLSSIVKLPLHRIQDEESLEAYGMDSIMAMDLTNQLEKSFGSLSKTLFFEYQTIKEVADYFLDSYGEKLQAILNLEKTNLDVNTPGGVTQRNPSTRKPERSRFMSLSETSSKTPASKAADIAIIGLVGRYPLAKNVNEFWINLREGRDCVTEIPEERWDHRLYFDEDRTKLNKTCSKWGGFLDGVDEFDPLFFNISPQEAAFMDPNERLFLETVWTLLEKTGYIRESLLHDYQARVGVYAGVMYQHYSAFGSSFGSIANRVSHFFDFQGPSIAIDTMCSASAIAIHMACESLAKGDCRIAIAGGVNLSICPEKYLGLSLGQMLGSRSTSRSFSDGDGMLPGEAVGAVLLKPLSKAIHEGDDILAVIKSTTTNHSGHTHGFSVPNPNAQAQLIEDNFRKSGIDPRTISYVESAANGSALGDPIEISGLKKAFQKFTPDHKFCAIGSVKSNIGHAEAASGISQLTKVVLQLQHQQLVPSIKAVPLNPHLNFDDTPFHLQQELREWKRPVLSIDGEQREIPRRATVSSFGAGGSNAHFIIEEYISEDNGSRLMGQNSGSQEIEDREIDQPVLIVLSAKNEDRLKDVVKNFYVFLNSEHAALNVQRLTLNNIAYTLQVGREGMSCRVAMVVKNKEELTQRLNDYLAAKEQGEELDASLPIFTGDTEDNVSDIKQLLSGKVEELVLQTFLAEKNLEKLALYWTQGGKIPWHALHEGGRLRRVTLPTYPFEKKRYWNETRSWLAMPEKQHTETPSNGIPDRLKTHPNSVEDVVTTIMVNLLGVEAAEFNPAKSLEHYGFDSILLTQFVQHVQAQVDPSINMVTLRTYKTLHDIISVLPKQISPKSVPCGNGTLTASGRSSRFPELIHLNQVSQGRPVFWFHARLGGVEHYQLLAEKSQRPFYGIQARGWMTDRTPLHGTEAMAAYYVHIIQTVQPEGPYDLGGHSLGGMLAYEVTRQLQEQGQVVSSIVMLDSLDTTAFETFTFSPKRDILQTVNFTLLNLVDEPENITGVLIHQNEVDVGLDDEAFLQHLIALAEERGLTKTEKQLRNMIYNMTKASSAYEHGYFSIQALLDPHVPCYYFRNRSGEFFGVLKPYYTLEGDELKLDHANYWSEWEQQLADFHLMDVDASSHMALLSEPKAYEPILKFCEALYSEEGISENFLKSFKRKTKKKYGTLDLKMIKQKDNL